MDPPSHCGLQYSILNHGHPWLGWFGVFPWLIMTYHDLSWLIMTYHDWPIRDLSLVRLPVVDGDVQPEMLAARGNEHRPACIFRPLLGTLPHCTATAMQQFCFPRIFGVPCQFSGGKWSITLPRNNPGPVGGWNSLTWEHQKMFWS